MNKKIQTYNDLLEEKQRLETLLSVQKQQMKTSWDHLLLEVTPVQSIFGQIKKVFKGDSSNPAVNFGVKFASDVFIRRVVLAKADWVTRLIVPMFFRNYTSNILNSEKSKNVFSKVKALFQRTPRRRNETGSMAGPVYSAQAEPSIGAPLAQVSTPESTQY